MLVMVLMSQVERDGFPCFVAVAATFSVLLIMSYSSDMACSGTASHEL